MRLLLKNEVICFTGKSKYTRNEMEKLAKTSGARVTRNISSETTLLVIGLRSGSKLDRAYANGIKLMIDEEFLRLVEKK